MSDRHLDGRVALVTGASRGIGAATVRLFAAQGARVALVARTFSAIEALSQEIRGVGGVAAAFPTDLSNQEALEALVASVRDVFGHVDILVNNAGVLPAARRAEEFSRSEWDDVMTIHVTVPWMLACRVKELMPPTGGVVVNVSSTAAFYPSIGLAPYNVSKAGLQMLSRVFALEWARDNVRVVSVAPGKVETELAQPILAYFEERRLALNPMRRVGGVNEVAELIAFLASDRSAYITGTVFTIDGGETLMTGGTQPE